MEKSETIENINNFDFWYPLEIEKASNKKDSKNKYENMILKGIASTDDIDLDGHELLNKGFDITYLLGNGFINWHHQSKYTPDAVIGEPIEGKIISLNNDNNKFGLFTKGILYDKPLSREVYDLALLLEEQSDTRRLGWSVEGKPLEKNGNRITKSILTGLAITFSPKNRNTFAEICKAFIDGSTTDKILKHNFQKSNQHNFNIKEKINDFNLKGFLLETDNLKLKFNNDGELHIIEKSMSTNNGKAITKESLEKDIYSKKHKDETKVLKKIFEKYPDISFEKAILLRNKVMNYI